MRTLIANICFISNSDNNSDWVLIDAGLSGSKDSIYKTAEEHFGKENPPLAIILTHGHFDHIGSITDLIKYWNVPVYAHQLELIFNRQNNYPSADPESSNGLMAKISPIYPNHSINLGTSIQPLPADGHLQ
jgi:glyoxylase-like metal-dependent hydrolase (beta-lactamase superfamily II)